jgi:hypothetical protein
MAASDEHRVGSGRGPRVLAASRAGRILQALVAALLLVTVTDGLAAAVWARPGLGIPVWSPAFSWSSLATGPARLPGDVRLTLRIEKQLLTAAYDLRLPKNGRLFAAIRDGGGAEDPDGLVDVLGAVSADGVQLAVKPSRILVEPGQPDGRVSLRTWPVPLRREQPDVVVQAPRVGGLVLDQVVVRTKGSRVVPRPTSTPVLQRFEQTEFRSVSDGVGFGLLLTPFVPTAAAPADPRSGIVPEGPRRDWVELVRREMRPPGAVSLTLQIKDQTLTATYDLTLPIRPVGGPDALLGAIQRGDGAWDSDKLAALLGTVTVEERAVSFRAPVVTVVEGDRDAKVSLPGDPMPLPDERSDVRVAAPARPTCCPALREVVVQTSGAQVMGGWALASQSPDRAVYREVGDDLRLTVVVTPFSHKRGQRPLSSLIRRFNQVGIPGLSPALFWLVVTAPLLVFLFWRRTDAAAASVPARSSVQAVETLLALYLIVLAAAAVATFTSRWSPATPAAAGLRSLGRWPGGRPDGSAGGIGILLLGAAVVWPGFARRRQRWPAPDDRVGLGSWLWRVPLGAAVALLVGLGVAAGLSAVPGGAGLLPLSDLAPVLSVGSLVLSLLCVWLLTVLGLGRRFVAQVAAVSILLVAVLLSHSSGEGWINGLLRLVVVTSVGFAMMLALLWVAAGALLASPWAARPAKGWVWQRLHHTVLAFSPATDRDRRARLAWLGAVVVLVALLVPNPRWSGEPLGALSGWYVLGLAYWLLYFVTLCFALVILSELRRRGGRRTSVFEPSVQALGIVLMLVCIFDPSFRFLYLPVPMLVGWALLAGWLLQRDAAPATVGSTAPAEGGTVAAVRGLVEAGARRRLAREARKERAKRPAGGGVEGPERAAEGGPGQVATGGPAAGAARPEVDVPAIRSNWVLARGPDESPWDNGKRFAGYSLLLSVPWVALWALRSDLGEPLQGRQYVLLSIVGLLIWDVLQWPVLGFFFGYFYPAIRGRTGLWKGLWLAVAVIVPWAVLDLLYYAIDDHGSWTRLVVWALQVFVTLVLTGFLGGDLRTLKQAGFGWKELRSDVYDFGTLAAWGSSVVVASGGAIVTLLTTTIGQVVSSQLTGGGAPPGR